MPSRKHLSRMERHIHMYRAWPLLFRLPRLKSLEDTCTPREDVIFSPSCTIYIVAGVGRESVSKKNTLCSACHAVCICGSTYHNSSIYMMNYDKDFFLHFSHPSSSLHALSHASVSGITLKLIFLSFLSVLWMYTLNIFALSCLWILPPL